MKTVENCKSFFARQWSFALGGFIVGMILMGIIAWKIMPHIMLTTHKSKLPFDETVTAINMSAKKHGWVVPKIYNFQESLRKFGYEDMTKIKVLSLCQPHYAYKILKEDSNKKVTAIMPCRFGVYETKDGQVYISEMNIRLMSKMFGGIIEKVMGRVAEEEEEMLKDIIED